VRILGVDVWDGYGPIDWRKVAEAGVRFVFVRCGEGNEPARDDRRFRANVAGARAAGIYVGTYFGAWTLPHGGDFPAGRSPKDQAARFLEASGGLGREEGELPPVVDAEWPPRFERQERPDGTTAIVNAWAKWQIPGEEFVARWLLEFLEEVERLWGRTPILYTYPDYWRNLGAWGRLAAWARFPLWIASYVPGGLHAWVPQESSRPAVPSPWEDWTFWQFSAEGSPIAIPGIGAVPVDRDVFRGDLDALRRLAGYDPEAETKPEVKIPTAPDRATIAPPAFEIVRGLVPLDRVALDGELPTTEPEDGEGPPDAA
jgi:lysozyme